MTSYTDEQVLHWISRTAGDLNEVLVGLLADRTRLQAEVETLKHEMQRFLPVLEALEEDHDVWGMATEGTGIATLNRYRHLIDSARAKKGDV